MVDHAALAFAGAREQHLLDDVFQRLGLRFHRARQRVAAQGAKAHLLPHRHFAGVQPHAFVVDHDQRARALDHRALGGKIQRHDGDVLQMDVLPDVELGPVADGEDADRFTRVLAAVVEVPQLGALVLGVPLVLGVAEAEDAFLGAALLFVAARAAEGGVEAMVVQRLLQALRLPDVGVQRRAVVEGVDAARLGLGVLPHQQLHPQFGGHALAQRIHVAELPGGVHVQQREGRRRRVEGLLRQAQHHGRILADRIQHHRAFALGHHLAQDVDAFGFQALQVGQVDGMRWGHGGRGRGRGRAAERPRVFRSHIVPLRQSSHKQMRPAPRLRSRQEETP